MKRTTRNVLARVLDEERVVLRVNPQDLETLREQRVQLLEEFEAIGGFSSSPDGAVRAIVRWMVEAYVGEPGGFGTFGRNRRVFYSDSAAPRIERLLRAAPLTIKGVVASVSGERSMKSLIASAPQKQRIADLLTITSSDTAV